MNKDTNHSKDSLRDSILSRIKTEQIAMRPRLYFTLQLAAVAVVALSTLLCTIFIFNFIVFSIRINGHDAFLQFGARGLSNFLLFFPWVILVLDIALVALLEWL